MKRRAVPGVLAVLLISSPLLAESLGSACSDEERRYIVPYNLILSPGKTGARPLELREHPSGRLVEGDIAFTADEGNPGNRGCQDALSISSDGFVTGLKAQRDDEVGCWVEAIMYDGDGTWEWAALSQSIVRVLSKDYDIPFKEVARKNTVLYFPLRAPNSPVANISRWVRKRKIIKVLEFANRYQASLMGLRPGGWCSRQAFEVDFGDTGANRVCGISGNPIRLGWNIEGAPSENCFILNKDAPHWGVILHELGHESTLDSSVFTRGLADLPRWSDTYIEGQATVIGLVTMREALREMKLNSAARTGLQLVYDLELKDAKECLDSDAQTSNLALECHVGVWLDVMELAGEDFVPRYYFLLDPRNEQHLDRVLSKVEKKGTRGTHTFFAALASAAADQDLFRRFKREYHFRISKQLFKETYRELVALLEAGQWASRPAPSSRSPARMGWQGCSLHSKPLEGN